MSKRRINKQQATRIARLQDTYQNEVSEHSEYLEGLVLARFGKDVELEDKMGQCFRCSLRPNLEHVIAGDQVVWLPQGDKQGVVVSIYPRTSVLERQYSGGIKKPVAANITQLVIVVSAKPEISWPLLDSYLIIAETLKLRPLIVMNKVDILEQTIQECLLSNYEPLGYSILYTSTKTNRGIFELNKALNNHVSVFVGQSGVGKSSLIAALIPNLSEIAIGSLSETMALGRHTTSISRYYHLPQGGGLIDSPGVREFGLWDMAQAELAQGYPEFRAFIPLCKYSNCSHQVTPGCALFAAQEQGRISKLRYLNFITLCAQQNRY